MKGNNSFPNKSHENQVLFEVLCLLMLLFFINILKIRYHHFSAFLQVKVGDMLAVHHKLIPTYHLL
ncbi:hypothetical protein Lalb_Chr07g0186951 [Lupinus albus]|uniref:Uncharacterized protein n=1 Tax=Lupinus albus TaxID=3870 RepID=A0A6A4Q9D9_LUPAL|nr:hypothetical protein Lalb_Chr07g0186951 [Lupinus albus]